MLLAVLLALSQAPTPSARLNRAEQAAVNATPEQIADRATVRNDPLDTVISISTEPFFQERQGLLRVVNSDKFMRAFIDKRTLQVRYQLYLWARYSGSRALSFNRLNYEAQDGPAEAELHQIDVRVEGCSRYIGCTYLEQIAADIPEETLRWAAASARPGADQSWSVRIFARAGQAVNAGILRTEVAGILIAVERQLTALRAARTPSE